jgi:hypothetical protein
MKTATPTVTVSRTASGFFLATDAAGRSWLVMGKRGEWTAQLNQRGALQTTRPSKEAIVAFIDAEGLECRDDRARAEMGAAFPEEAR